MSKHEEKRPLYPLSCFKPTLATLADQVLEQFQDEILLVRPEPEAPGARITALTCRFREGTWRDAHDDLQWMIDDCVHGFISTAARRYGRGDAGEAWMEVAMGFARLSEAHTPAEIAARMDFGSAKYCFDPEEDSHYPDAPTRGEES